jgi:hypothetical protein
MTDYKLAEHIVVDRDERGAPRITIDGEVLPWHTCGIVPSVPKLNEAPTLTVTFLAEKVTTIDQYVPREEPPASWLPVQWGASGQSADGG